MNFASPLDDSRKDLRWYGLLVCGLRTGEPCHPRDRLRL